MENSAIILQPVEMNKEIMQELEKRGLIYRIAPGLHNLNPDQGEALVKTIYECKEEYGPHKLISVTINRTEFTTFGTHPDTEDFLLIGDPNTKPLYLVIALCKKDELERKIGEKTVSAKDFVALKVKYNDPEISFFSMLKDVPHGEAVGDEEGKPASFYVTEAKNLTRDLIDFHGYKLKIIC